MTTTMSSNPLEINGKERTRDVLIEGNINFDSLLLSDSTLEGLKKCSFQKPSPIQLKAIPLGRCGFDLIVKSKSGTGKTAVFAVIALEMLNLSKQQLQVLIVAPTREIALQGCDVINSIGAEFKGLKASCFIGGMSVEDDIQKTKGCQIAVGTPGRLKHLIQSSHLKTDRVKLFILDEADKLMESSYQSDINEIYHRLPLRKQMLALSATYPDELDAFLAKYMHTPTHVTAEMETPLLLGLKPVVCLVKASLNVMQQMTIKIDKIVDILSRVSFTQCLIFTNFQTRAESVSNTLNRKGWCSNFISGSQSQEERIEAIKGLKESKCKILLSTDLTARGIDASNVDLVINFDVPHDASTYLHRMGRAGRYGSRGICVTLASKGKECTQFEGILGLIGGNGFKIARMPEEIPENIWDLDLSTFEQITGKIPEGDYTEESLRLKNIKSSILSLKSCDENKTDFSATTEVSVNSGNKIKTESSTDRMLNGNDAMEKSDTTEDILQLLSQGKRPDNPVSKSGSKVDSTMLSEKSKSRKLVANKPKETKVRDESEPTINTIGVLKMLSGNQNNESSFPGLGKSENNEINKKDETQLCDRITEESKSEINTIDVLKMLSGKPINQSKDSNEAKSTETDFCLDDKIESGSAIDVLKMLSGDHKTEQSCGKTFDDTNKTTEENKSEINTIDILKMLSGNEINKSNLSNVKTTESDALAEKNGAKALNIDKVDVMKALLGDETIELCSDRSNESKQDSIKQNNLNTTDVLKMLCNKQTESQTISPNSENDLQSKTNLIKIKSSEDSSSKRKREYKKHTRREKKRSLICEKNVTLLNVTKLLLNDDSCEGEDVTGNISSYLDKMKGEVSSRSSSESESLEMEVESSDSISAENKNEESSEITTTADESGGGDDGTKIPVECGDIVKNNLFLDKENIFLHAYESALDPLKSHWSQFIDNYPEESLSVQKEEEAVVNLLNCSDDYEEDESEEVTYYRKNKSRNRKKSWTKRKNNKISNDLEDNSYINNGLSSEFQNTLFNPDSNTLQNNEVQHQNLVDSTGVYPPGLCSYHEYSNCKTFDLMFENCSKDLEEKVNEIEDVASYNSWFINWQQQVQSVRDYVQQNVYIQEMNRYQYYKTN